ncbi:hypothetical protein ABZS66_60505, partial [Dactylosporangium sp. NPDC005572]|uniref:hypothetical protein n=1 Tax=Dactylosporangium sp. NPDC005572 TaxID=3156889 RepID=UPI0033BB8451
ARPPDRRYLRRGAACRRCPAPCEFLHEAREARSPQEQAADLEAWHDALLLGTAPRAWTAWQRWRRQWPDEAGVGVLNCAATQSAGAWAERLLRARGGTPLAARQIVLRARAEAAVAELAWAWLDRHELDAEATERFAATQAALRQLLGGPPQPELPGCATCPARCLVLPYTARLNGTLDSVAARATAGTSAPVRLQSVRKLLDPHLRPLAAGLGEDLLPALTHCAITQSAPAGEPAVLEVLTELAASAGPAATPAR